MEEITELLTASNGDKGIHSEEMPEFAPGKMEEHFYSFLVNNKLTIANGGGGNVHVQVI